MTNPQSPICNSPASKRLEALVTKLRACTLCPKMHRPAVSGGAVVSRVMSVGQAPGVKEPVLGRPFAWTAGKTLYGWFTAACGWSEADFRARSPGKILIAEPWSFRGHVARDLDDSTWTSWDDAFREFLPSFVRGHARAADLLHQVAACGARPSARLRYAQSHDDMAWLDRITERPANDARDPAPADVLRTRLMHAVLLCSAGIPMLAAGQDFLATKRGVGNTWRHGELNRLDPARLERFRGEHEFVARLIGFRLSAVGAILRPRAPVSAGWMRAAFAPPGEAFAAVLNADGAMGPTRVLLACNPHDQAVTLTVPSPGPWHPVVLSPVPSCRHAPGPVPTLVGDRLELPPLGCGVWSIGG